MDFVDVHDLAQVEVVGRSSHAVRIFRRGGVVRTQGRAEIAEQEEAR